MPQRLLAFRDRVSFTNRSYLVVSPIVASAGNVMVRSPAWLQQIYRAEGGMRKPAPMDGVQASGGVGFGRRPFVVASDMTANDKLYVEVLDDEIIITLPGTSYTVTYYRATAFPQRLLTKSHSGGEDHDAPMTQAEFHGRAWRLANDKARERGWIV